MLRDIRRSIVSERRDDEGQISGFMLNDGTVVDYASALQLAKHGELKDVDVVSQSGREVIINRGQRNA